MISSSYDVETSYKVIDVYNDMQVMEGKAVIHASSSEKLAMLPVTDDSRFYIIEWTDNGEIHRNHYCTNLIGIDYWKYLSAIEKYQFDRFEGMNV